MYDTDTIAAISTAPGTAGIGIIRMSGPGAFAVAERLFEGHRPFREIGSHAIRHGRIVDPRDGTVVDEVLLSKMAAPNTFTREDVVEINCHGGTAVLRRILGLLAVNGVRMAEPGEFTRRAFLNGRIDLSQSEAVIDLIQARTERGSRIALEQLEGKLSRKVKALRERLVSLLARIEATVDFPELDLEETTGREVHSEAGLLLHEMEELISGYEKGRILREGITVVIAGKPNVGKSSLLNALAGKNRAIVTDIPGTTRDLVEEEINIEGIPVRLVDTAGIRTTEDVIERMGVERAREAMEKADLILMVADAREGFEEEDLALMRGLDGKKVIALLNKIDLTAGEADSSRIPEEIRVLRISATEDRGIGALEAEIARRVLQGEVEDHADVLVTNIRHKMLLETAAQGLRHARQAYSEGLPLDCLSIDLREAARAMDGITGESVDDAVLEQIFSRFCIGK